MIDFPCKIETQLTALTSTGSLVVACSVCGPMLLRSPHDF